MPDGWSVSKHDTVGIALWLNPLEGHAYLQAFLEADGEPFAPPYTAVREPLKHIVDELQARSKKGQAPKADVSPERIRTWKSLFESFGLILVEEETGLVRASPLGRAVRALYDQLNRRIEGANDHLAALAVDVLVRYRLRNPIDGGDYPEDSDLHPFRLMWRAMRELDNKLHWQELNRVLMHVHYEHEVPAAIEHLRVSRKASSGASYSKTDLAGLGDPVVEEDAETTRRITPWFARAGFGGLLIGADADSGGFRHLVPKYIPLLDAALKETIAVPADALISRNDYLKYLTEQAVLAPTATADDEQEIKRVIAAADRYGDRKIIVLSGIPGTGKTRLARLAAARLVDGDPYRVTEVQFHENTGYESFVEGFVPRPGGEGFELRPRTFRVINRRARLDPADARYVLIIEELTRANVHAVLGELLTYIEHRGRTFQWAVSQDEDSVAPNLIILATMNPRDRSATVLDHAILRRLHQIDLPPSTDVLGSILEGKLPPTDLAQLTGWFDKFRAVLPFGHGEFAEVASAKDLHELWEGTLKYFLMDPTGAYRPAYQQLADEYPWR